jgi:integrase
MLTGVGERWRVAVLLSRYVDAAGYWSPATAARRERAARLVARDGLGAVRVGRLSPVVLEAASGRWRAAGLGAATMRAMRDVVRFAVSWAVGQGWLVVDVLAGVAGAPGCVPRGQVPVRVVRAVVAAARREVRSARDRFVRSHQVGVSPAGELAVFRAEQRLLLVLLVADTGLRRGELAGLRSDDLLGRELWIERAVKRGPRGGVVVGPTKSHRHGRLTVSAATARYWQDHIHAWPSAHAGCVRSAWLFRATPQATRPLSPGALAARFVRATALAEAGRRVCMVCGTRWRPRSPCTAS